MERKKRRKKVATYPSLGPPWVRSNTCRGFRYHMKERMIFVPFTKEINRYVTDAVRRKALVHHDPWYEPLTWFPPLLGLTNTSRGLVRREETGLTIKCFHLPSCWEININTLWFLSTLSFKTSVEDVQEWVWLPPLASCWPCFLKTSSSFFYCFSTMSANSTAGTCLWVFIFQPRSAMKLFLKIVKMTIAGTKCKTYKRLISVTD